MKLQESEQQGNGNGIVVAGARKVKNDCIRMTFRGWTMVDGKRQDMPDGITLKGGDSLLLAPTKNKKSDKTPDYVVIASQ